MTTESDVMAAFKLLAEAIAAEKELQAERTRLEKLVNEVMTKHGQSIRLVETRREKLASLASVPMSTVVAKNVLPMLVPALPPVVPTTVSVPTLKTEPLPPARDQKKKVS